ncbi:uncharacterized protein METZ01_LOCUS264111 [marine metagenome]|uniref:Uncharacterized protein n=1 Tax=marine metagenome TaxID=408172 RepID=A0A382JJG5_9ZZZZ
MNSVFKRPNLIAPTAAAIPINKIPNKEK